MPIDPNIALQVKPIDDYNTMLQKSMALKNAQQQSQLGTIQLQQDQQAQQDQQHVRDFYNSGAPFDENAIMKAAGPKLGQQIITSHYKALTDQADLAKKQQEVQANAKDLVGGLALAIQQSGYNPAVTETMLQTAERNPSFAQEAGNLRQMLKANPDQFKQIIDGVVAQSKNSAESFKNLQQGGEAAAKIPGAVAESQRQQKLNAGTNDQGITADQLATLANEGKRIQAETARDQFNQMLGKQRLGIDTARLGIEQSRLGQEKQGSFTPVYDQEGNLKFFNPKSGQTVEPPAGFTKTNPKPTADEAKRADMATNLNENLDALEDIVKRRPELFGPVGGRYMELKMAAGTSDPDIAKLETIKHQLGMVQLSTHGMRSAQGIEGAAQSLLNFHNAPEAIKGSIKAARDSAKTFTDDAAGKKGGAPKPDPLGIR